MAAGKINRRMPIGLVALEVQVAAALTLLRELPQVVWEHLGKVRTVVRVLAVQGGLRVAVAAHQP